VTQSKPSKSAQKREQLELQQLGEQLLDFTVEELRALPIDERLREAVLAAAKMRAHGALRRQKQLIGKLMRTCDPEPVRQAVAARAASDRQVKRVFADAERWRDRIVAEGSDAVRSFCEHSGARAAPLDELLARIRSAQSDRVEKGLRRQLFRAIHDALIAAAQDDRISR
jgi:ribosome-associated protein